MTTYKIGIIGSGQVAQTLAKGYKKYGYDVMIGSRTAERVSEFAAALHIAHGTFEQTAAFAEVLILAVKGDVALEALALCGVEHLNGKIVIDPTNPIAALPPANGVLQYFTETNHSLMEKLQMAYPQVRFVKAFSCVGNAHMIDPDFGGQKPSMFICGNNDDARKAVTAMLEQFGWEVEDMGMAEAARAIEPLCMLWCIPGMNGKGWNHAFKLLKK